MPKPNSPTHSSSSLAHFDDGGQEGQRVSKDFETSHVKQKVNFESFQNTSQCIVLFVFVYTYLCWAVKPIVICIECRFSDPTSTTSLDKAAIAQKRELTISQFRPYFEEGMILPPFESIHWGNLQENSWMGFWLRNQTCSWSSVRLGKWMTMLLMICQQTPLCWIEIC